MNLWKKFFEKEEKTTCDSNYEIFTKSFTDLLKADPTISASVSSSIYSSSMITIRQLKTVTLANNHYDDDNLSIDIHSDGPVQTVKIRLHHSNSEIKVHREAAAICELLEMSFVDSIFKGRPDIIKEFLRIDDVDAFMNSTAYKSLVYPIRGKLTGEKYEL